MSKINRNPSSPSSQPRSQEPRTQQQAPASPRPPQNEPRSSSWVRPLVNPGDAARSAWQGVNRAADRAGRAVRSAGETLERAGRAIESAPERAADVAQRAARNVQQGVERGVETVRRTARAAEHGADVIAHEARETLQDVRHVDRFDNMREGSTTRQQFDAEVSVEGGAARASQAFEVRRTREGFDVAMELGGEATSQWEAGVEAGSRRGGAEANASAEAGVQGGVRGEFRFQTPDEVARARDLMRSMNNLNGPAALLELDNLSSADARFMREHMTAVEVHGGTVGRAGLDVGANVGVGAGAGVEGVAGQRGTLRVELDPATGRPTNVEVRNRNTLSGEAAAEATVGPLSVGIGEASARAEVETRTRVAVPDGVDAVALITGDAQANRRVADAVRNAPTDVTLRTATETDSETNTTETTFRVAPHQRGGVSERALQGDFAGAVSSAGAQSQVESRTVRSVETGDGRHRVDTTTTVRTNGAGFTRAAGDLLTGNSEAALRALGRDATHQREVTVTRDTELELSPELSVMGFGGGLGVDLSRRDVVTSYRSPELRGDGTVVGEAARRGTLARPIPG